MVEVEKGAVSLHPYVRVGAADNFAEVLANQGMRVDGARPFEDRLVEQAHPSQRAHRGVPGVILGGLQVPGIRGHGDVREQRAQGLRRGGPVEQADKPEDGQLGGLAVVVEPARVGRHDPARVPAFPGGYRQVADVEPPVEVTVVDVPDVVSQQGDGQRVTVDGRDRLPELASRRFPSDELLQQVGTVVDGQVLQVQPDDRARVLVAVQVGERDPGGDQARAVPARFGQVAQQRAQRFVGELATDVGSAERVLERLDPVQHQQQLVLPDQGGELMAPLAGVDADLDVVAAEPGHGGADERVRRDQVLLGALAVEGPGENLLSSSVVVLAHLVQPRVDQR